MFNEQHVMVAEPFHLEDVQTNTDKFLILRCPHFQDFDMHWPSDRIPVSGSLCCSALVSTALCASSGDHSDHAQGFVFPSTFAITRAAGGCVRTQSGDMDGGRGRKISGSRGNQGSLLC